MSYVDVVWKVDLINKGLKPHLLSIFNQPRGVSERWTWLRRDWNSASTLVLLEFPYVWKVDLTKKGLKLLIVVITQISLLDVWKVDLTKKGEMFQTLWD